MAMSAFFFDSAQTPDAMAPVASAEVARNFLREIVFTDYLKARLLSYLIHEICVIK